MAQNVLIELTLASDSTKVQVSPQHILHVHPRGTGSSVEFVGGDTLQVTEAPSDVKTAANT